VVPATLHLRGQGADRFAGLAIFSGQALRAGDAGRASAADLIHLAENERWLEMMLASGELSRPHAARAIRPSSATAPRPSRLRTLSGPQVIRRSQIGKGSGYMHCLIRPDAVRYVSVTTAMHRPAVTHALTRRKRPALAVFPQPGGRFRWCGRCWVRTNVG
jgi:hypothetical protein